MNDTLIKTLISVIESTETFVVSNAPGYAQELLTYGLVSSSFALGTGILFTFLGIISMVIVFKYNNDLIQLIGTILCIMFLVIGPIAIVINTSDLIKIKIAPKVYILDHLTKDK